MESPPCQKKKNICPHESHSAKRTPALQSLTKLDADKLAMQVCVLTRLQTHARVVHELYIYLLILQLVFPIYSYLHQMADCFSITMFMCDMTHFLRDYSFTI